MIRIPDAGRFELRLADGAANPYLLPAALLAAGLDGVERRLDPGKRLDINMYEEAHLAEGAKKTPSEPARRPSDARGERCAEGRAGR